MAEYSTVSKIKAWSVHLFTATGVLAAFWAIVSIGRGDLRMGLICLLIAQLIDALDGSFARYYKVKEVLPQVDGKMIDAVIDFSTYALIPAYLFYAAGLCSAPWDMIAVVSMLMASALYYGLPGMVTEDLHFKGFPVLWNFAVGYMLVVLHWPSWANFGLVILLSIWHFVPTKFLYPSRTQKNFFLTLGVLLIMGIAILRLIFIFPVEEISCRIICLAGGLYYLGMSIWNSLKPVKISEK